MIHTGSAWRNFFTVPRVSAPMTHSKPTRRATVKVIHAVTLPLFIWFMFVTPDHVNAIGPWAFQLHSFFGLIFVSLALIWTISHIRHGLVGRPGPKLGPRGRRLHQSLHKVLIWGLFCVALTGFALGVTATTQLWAGNLIPIGYPLKLRAWNDIAGQVHIVQFYTLAGIAIFHAGFHTWRHVKLSDNALRIMAPRILHRFL